MTTKKQPRQSKKKYPPDARLQELEDKMKAFMEDKGPMPNDEEIRELCNLRNWKGGK